MPLVSPGRIESPQLLVRLAVESDLPDLLKVNGDEKVTRYLPYPAWKSIADGEAWLKRMLDLQNSGSALQFVIVQKQTGIAIGTCGLFQFEQTNAQAKIGYVLGGAYWGQGYMREALTALIDCAFNDLALRRLEADVETRNVSSTGLLLRLGFTKEGVLRERWVTKEGTTDAEVYGLLRHEWPRRIQSEGPTG